MQSFKQLPGNFFLIGIVLLVSVATTKIERQSDVKKILFVGNSLTYTNNLPDLVAKIGESKSVNIKVETLAFPDYALVDHWNDKKLQKMIKSGNYDFVVVQQGPSSQAEGRAMLLDYCARINELCKRHQARLVVFMVWPARQNFHMFDGVVKNHTDAATQNDALLCPVGKVWKDYVDSTKDYSYYSSDNFHPSLKGSKVAAEVIYKTLFP